LDLGCAKVKNIIIMDQIEGLSCVCVCIFFHANLFGSDYFMYVCVFVIVVVGLCVIFREYSLIFVYLCVNIDWLFSLGSATFFSAPT